MSNTTSLEPVFRSADGTYTEIYGLGANVYRGQFSIQVADGTFSFVRNDLEAAFFARFVRLLEKMILQHQPDMIVVQMNRGDALRLSWMFQDLSAYTIYDGSKGPEHFECVGLRLGHGVLPIRLRVYNDDRRELVVALRNQVADD